jgi:hypothetical protein
VTPNNKPFFEVWEFTPGGNIWVTSPRTGIKHLSSVDVFRIPAFNECTKGSVEFEAVAWAVTN